MRVLLALVLLAGCELDRTDTPHGRVIAGCIIVRDCAPVIVSSPIPVRRPDDG